MRIHNAIPAVLLLAAAGFCPAQDKSDALLVIAHGADKGPWNSRVAALSEKIDWPGPKGVAFLTPSKPEESLEAVAAQLDQPGVRSIRIVPLFISSFSNHYEEIRFYAGLRPDAGDHAHGHPLHTRAKLVLGGAMDAHPLLGRILAEQLRAVSQQPAAETVVLVAHGPNDEADNEHWLKRLRELSAQVSQQSGFRGVQAVTLRDDAPAPVRDAATAALRAIVEKASASGPVLVQPVLISTGRLQGEIAERLAGLTYKLSPSGVVNHPLTLEWIRQQASALQ